MANVFKVNVSSISKIWHNFCENSKVGPNLKGRDRCSKLTEGDLKLIEVLKTVKGSLQLGELYSILDEVGHVESVSLSTISRAVQSQLLSGKRYTPKRITHVAAERFTNENMIYTLIFMDYLSSKNWCRVKFFNEAEVKTPDIGTGLHGNAPSENRCVEIARKKGISKLNIRHVHICEWTRIFQFSMGQLTPYDSGIFFGMHVRLQIM